MRQQRNQTQANRIPALGDSFGATGKKAWHGANEAWPQHAAPRSPRHPALQAPPQSAPVQPTCPGLSEFAFLSTHPGSDQSLRAFNHVFGQRGSGHSGWSPTGLRDLPRTRALSPEQNTTRWTRNQSGEDWASAGHSSLHHRVRSWASGVGDCAFPISDTPWPSLGIWGPHLHLPIFIYPSMYVCIHVCVYPSTHPCM